MLCGSIAQTDLSGYTVTVVNLDPFFTDKPALVSKKIKLNDRLTRNLNLFLDFTVR